MKILICALSLVCTQFAFAGSINVDCGAPAGFAGQAATMKGTLKTAGKTPEGYAIASGKLKITVGGSTARSLYNKTVSVRGAVLADGAITMASDRNPELSLIYVNPNRKDVSYVELDGKMYLSNCTKGR